VAVIKETLLKEAYNFFSTGKYQIFYYYFVWLLAFAVLCATKNEASVVVGE
jgi:hypothetical protein